MTQELHKTNPQNTTTPKTIMPITITQPQPQLQPQSQSQPQSQPYTIQEELSDLHLLALQQLNSPSKTNPEPIP